MEGALGGRVAEDGGESIGSRTEGLSMVLSLIEFGDEGDKGVVGRGLSGDGVRDIERNGGPCDFSLRKGPSMMMFVVGRESTRVSMEKVVEELTRKMGEGISCMRASTEAIAERAGGRSGEREGRGGDFE